MSNKKIVHLISSLQRGGAEKLLLTLTHELKEFEHHVFFIHDGPLKKDFSSLVSLYHVKGRVYTYTPAMVYHLYKSIKKIQPCCIHTSLWAAGILGRILGRLLKIPVICAVHTVCEHEGKIRTFIERIIPVQPTHYIAVAPRIATSLTQWRKIDPASITIIKNGIDNPSVTTFTKNDTFFTIGSVGRFVPVKNYDLLLKSFTQLRKNHTHCRLMLLGEGPEEQALRRLAQDLSIEQFVIFIVGQDAQSYYAQFDCFVQPSKFEGLSLALLEALQQGLPVVVAGGDKKHDVIAHGHNGLVIEPNNPEALIDALNTIIMKPALRQQLQNNGLKTVRDQFSLEKMIKEYRDTIHHATRA